MTALIVNQETTNALPDLSRDARGVIHMTGFDAFRFMGRVQYGEPTAIRHAERFGIVTEDGMDLTDWALKNKIELPWMSTEDVTRIFKGAKHE
jgi:hypothetical protein